MIDKGEKDTKTSFSSYVVSSSVSFSINLKCMPFESVAKSWTFGRVSKDKLRGNGLVTRYDSS